jgi:hypothetical protein
MTIMQTSGCMLVNSKLNTRYIPCKCKVCNTKPGKKLHEVFPHPVDLSGGVGNVLPLVLPAQTRVHYCFATISTSMRMRRAAYCSHVPSIIYRSRADWAVVKEAAAKKANKHSCLWESKNTFKVNLKYDILPAFKFYYLPLFGRKNILLSQILGLLLFRFRIKCSFHLGTLAKVHC